MKQAVAYVLRACAALMFLITAGAVPASGQGDNGDTYTVRVSMGGQDLTFDQAVPVIRDAFAKQIAIDGRRVSEAELSQLVEAAMAGIRALTGRAGLRTVAGRSASGTRFVLNDYYYPGTP